MNPTKDQPSKPDITKRPSIIHGNNDTNYGANNGVIDENENLPSSAQCCMAVLMANYPHRLYRALITESNEKKKTFCFWMQYHMMVTAAFCRSQLIDSNHHIDQNIINMIYAYHAIECFVKIYENARWKPLEIERKLQKLPLNHQLNDDLIIAQETGESWIGSKKYEIVCYEFIPHVTFEVVVFYTIINNILNPRYFLYQRQIPWKFGIKAILLKACYRCTQIVINLFNHRLVDCDTSASNIIFKTVNNGRFCWNDICPSNQFKIDNESMVAFPSNGEINTNEMRKPIKAECTPPELRIRQDILIDVEKFCVFQLCAMFIFVLFGQAQILNENREIEWITVGVHQNNVLKQKLGWSPKLHLVPDLAFLEAGVAYNPSHRPTLYDLLCCLDRAIKYNMRNTGVILNSNPLPRPPRRPSSGYNNLHQMR